MDSDLSTCEHVRLRVSVFTKKNSHVLFWPPRKVCVWQENERQTQSRGMPGCHGNGFWQTVCPLVFKQGGSNDNKDKVCVALQLRLLECHTHTHSQKGFAVHFLVSYKWSECGGRRSPLAAPPGATFSHQSRFNDRSTFENIDKSIKKYHLMH